MYECSLCICVLGVARSTMIIRRIFFCCCFPFIYVHHAFHFICSLNAVLIASVSRIQLYHVTHFASVCVCRLNVVAAFLIRISLLHTDTRVRPFKTNNKNKCDVNIRLGAYIIFNYSKKDDELMPIKYYFLSNFSN